MPAEGPGGALTQSSSLWSDTLDNSPTWWTDGDHQGPGRVEEGKDDKEGASRLNILRGRFRGGGGFRVFSTVEAPPKQEEPISSEGNQAIIC